MVKFADAIAADALSDLDKEAKPNPKILELEEEIEYLREGIKRFGDKNGEKAARVAILQSEIGQLAAIPISQVISDELMAELAELSSVEILREASNDARRNFFLTFLDRVTIDFASKTAIVSFSRNISFARPDKL
jgi:cell division septum initiation protein DivIVA